MGESFCVFTLDPEERFVVVRSVWGTRRPAAALTAREAKKALQASVKTMFGDLAGVEPEVLACDGATSTFVVKTDKGQLRALWLSVSCVETLGEVPCVLRVLRVSSTLVGASAGLSSGA